MSGGLGGSCVAVPGSAAEVGSELAQRLALRAIEALSGVADTSTAGTGVALTTTVCTISTGAGDGVALDMN